jgi:histidinol dehydrogenase
VGLCVPGGAAAYPSTVLMTAVPAQVAGVRELAVVAPPTAFGAYNDDLLATCHELGIGEVYRLGGAQGVAALAYGVEGVPRVDKIVGPGNLFVALAKRHVFGEVDIDSIAGPSEVLIVADGSADAGAIAADMLAQAEHDPEAAAVCVTPVRRLAERVAAALAEQLGALPRQALAARSLARFGAIVVTASLADAMALANRLAPEHLELLLRAPARWLPAVRNAGAVFVGAGAPEAFGDYLAGPNHVLPTGGTARFASGLSTNDFLRRTSVIHYTAAGLGAAAEDVRILADTEGLTAHRASVDIRCRDANS